MMSGIFLSTLPKKIKNLIFDKRQKERKKKEKPQAKSPEKKEKQPSNCPHHFGYLAIRDRDESIPQECLVCPKLLECMRG